MKGSILRQSVSMCIYIIGLHCYVISGRHDEHSLDIFHEVERDFKKFVETNFRYSIPTNHNDRPLEEFTLEAMDRRKDEVDAMFKKLALVKKENFDKDRDRQNFLVLNEVLNGYLEGAKWNRYGSLSPLSFIDPYPYIIWRSLEDKTLDVERYWRLLNAFCDQLKEMQGLMEKAIDLNRTNYLTTMRNIGFPPQPGSVNESVVIDPFMQPLLRLNLSQDSQEWNTSVAIIEDNLKPGIRDFSHFLYNVYMNHTRPQPGVGSLDNGQEYYQACLDHYIGRKGITARDVHDIGLKEVDRIQKIMQKTLDEWKFKGSIREFIEYLQTEQRNAFYDRSPRDLINGYKRMIYDVINPNLHKIVSNIPPGHDIKIINRITPGPSGSYNYPNLYVNVLNSEDRPIYLMKNLALHEANPGHHLQTVFLKEQNLPFYRSLFQLVSFYLGPSRFPFFSSNIEGWALYAENLGETMGVYNKTALESFGRYSAEMLRACRLVVDTGIHAFNMTIDEAIAYLQRYTAVPYDQIVSEIDRYIAWPGQACSYKMGELEIFRIRDKAQQMLGELYDLREFNEHILRLGPMPFNLLDEEIQLWARRTLERFVLGTSVNDAPLLKFQWYLIFPSVLCIFL